MCKPSAFGLSVAQVLVLNRISAEGKGLTSPITTNEPESGRSKHKRVEILLYYQC